MDNIIESEHSVVLAKNTRSDSDQSEPNVQCYTCGFEAKRSLMKEHMTVNHKGNLNPCFCICRNKKSFQCDFIKTLGTCEVWTFLMYVVKCNNFEYRIRVLELEK